MNSFTNTMLTVMLGWLRTLLNAVSGLLTSDSSTAFLDFFRSSWRVIFIVLCIGGFALDKIVYIIRWRPKPRWLRRRKRQKEHTPVPGSVFADALRRRQCWCAAGRLRAGSRTKPLCRSVCCRRAVYRRHENPTIPDTARAIPAAGADTQMYQPYATPQYAPEVCRKRLRTPASLHSGMTMRRHRVSSPRSGKRTRAHRASSPYRRKGSGLRSAWNRRLVRQRTNPLIRIIRTRSEPLPRQSRHRRNSRRNPMRRPRMSQCLTTHSAACLRPMGRIKARTSAPFPTGEASRMPRLNRAGLARLPRRARNLFNPENAYESMTYQDLQPTVDVSQAFHAPVYPEKKPEGDA